MQRKMCFVLGVVLILVMSMISITLACTSFAVYGENGPVFGMNWDVPLRGKEEILNDYLRIVMYSDSSAIFGVAHDYVLNPFYNEFGVFGAWHIAAPVKEVKTRRERRVTPNNLFSSGALSFKKTSDVVNRLLGARLFLSHMRTNFQCLFADSQGAAIIIAPGVEHNHILHTTGDYIIMTNFFNHLLENASPHFFESLDFDSRYRTADYIIKESFEYFGYKEALNVLMATKQRNTKVSIVVVPEKQEIYVALFGDFFRIWQVDFAAQTIATYKGFTEYRIESLDATGFTLSQLQEWK